MSFDPAQHPRETTGQFAEKTGAAAEISLSESPRAVDGDRPQAPELALAPEKRPQLAAVGDDHSITFTLPDGDEVDVDHDARIYAGHIDPAAFQNDDGSFDVLYAAYDDDSPEYEFMDGDSLEGFASAYDRDAYIESKLSDGVAPENIFVVEKYEHGAVRYSSLGNWADWRKDQRSERERLSDGWDSAPSHVYIAGESANPNEQATSILDDYTAWANGEVYIVTRLTVDENGEEQDREDVHGFIGTDSAEETINGGEI